MQPYLFEYSPPLLRRYWLRNVLVIEFISLSMAVGFWVGPDNSLWSLQSFLRLFKIFVFFAVLNTLLASLFFFKIVYTKFQVTEYCIKVKKRFYPWDTMIDYHMLGESQDERAGGVTNVATEDLFNAYTATNIVSIRLRPRLFQRTLNLQVAPERLHELENILHNHSVSRTPAIQFYVYAINKWFVLLLVLPTIVFILYLLVSGTLTARDFIEIFI